jgi:hypothetical protein
MSFGIIDAWHAGCAVCHKKLRVLDNWQPIGDGDDIVHAACASEYVEPVEEDEDDA